MGSVDSATPRYRDSHVTVHVGDCIDVLRTLPDESAQCCVTSPPYWGLRDYGVEGQLGLESTPEEYVSRLVEVFREVRRVLRADGTLFLNLGDSYASNPANGGPQSQLLRGGPQNTTPSRAYTRPPGLKPKDLVGIPWRVAFALQADGWWLRSDIIWAKPNPMPESVTDRPTKAHEYVFLLSKSARYFYDADAVSEPALQPLGEARKTGQDTANMRRKITENGSRVNSAGSTSILGSNQGSPTRNRRSVWTITTKPYPEAHFATFPPELPTLCIKAGCPIGGTVLDLFSGSGTTSWVAKGLNRNAVAIELNPEYAELIMKRCAQQVLAL